MQMQMKKRRATMWALAIGLGIGSTMLVKNSSAFTLIELTEFFNPYILSAGQGAQVVVNNTLGSQEVHVHIDWRDATTGATLQSSDENVRPGLGVVTPPFVPAVQNPALHAVVAVLKLSPAPGGAAISPADASKIGASLVIVDETTHRPAFMAALASLPTAVE